MTPDEISPGELSPWERPHQRWQSPGGEGIEETVEAPAPTPAGPPPIGPAPMGPGTGVAGAARTIPAAGRDAGAHRRPPRRR